MARKVVSKILILEVCTYNLFKWHLGPLLGPFCGPLFGPRKSIELSPRAATVTDHQLLEPSIEDNATTNIILPNLWFRPTT